METGKLDLCADMCVCLSDGLFLTLFRSPVAMRSAVLPTCSIIWLLTGECSPSLAANVSYERVLGLFLRRLPDIGIIIYHLSSLFFGVLSPPPPIIVYPLPCVFPLMF